MLISESGTALYIFLTYSNTSMRQQRWGTRAADTGKGRRTMTGRKNNLNVVRQ